MGFNSCQVLSCRSRNDPARVYHKFPLDPDRCNQWLKILGKKSTDIKTKSVVCSRHFRFKDYYSGGRRLLPSAVPMLRLKDSPKAGKSEPNKQKIIIKNHLKSFKKSPPLVMSNQLKGDKSSKLLDKSLTSAVKLNTLKRKLASQLNKGISNPKSNKQSSKIVLKANSNKSPSEKAMQASKELLKLRSLSTERNQLKEKNNSLSQSTRRLLRNNADYSHLKVEPGDKITQSMLNCELKSKSKDRTCLTNHKSQNTKKEPNRPVIKENCIDSKNNIDPEIVSCPQTLSKNSVDSNQAKTCSDNVTHIETNLPSDDPLNNKKPNSLSDNSVDIQNSNPPMVKFVNDSQSKSQKCSINENKTKPPENPVYDNKTKPHENHIIDNLTKPQVMPISDIKSKSSSDKSVNDSKSLENPANYSKHKSTSSMPMNISEPKTTEQSTSTDDETNIARTRRSIKKRKRLVSESESENDVDIPKNQTKLKSKKKVQKHKNNLDITINDLKHSYTSSKNLSEIEKTILEMQNKIQMLEKKAILDEKKIETFKRTQIAQRIRMLMDEKENELLLRMDLLYLDYDPRKICRLCLQLVEKKEDLTPLFWPQENQVLLSLIKQATNVEVEEEDGMPSCICGECLEEIRRVDWLKRRTQKSNAMLKKFVALKKNPSQSKSYQMTDELKVKYDEALSEEVIPNVKIEDVFSLENSPVALFENITIKEEQESDVESIPDYELNTTYSIAVKRPVGPQKCGRCSQSFKHPWKLMVHSRYCAKRFQCSECNRCFFTSSSFRRHKQATHFCYCPEHLRYCSDCDISFRWKWQLVFHVLRHNTQVCACGGMIHSAEHLQRHLAEVHRNYIYWS